MVRECNVIEVEAYLKLWKNLETLVLRSFGEGIPRSSDMSWNIPPFPRETERGGGAGCAVGGACSSWRLWEWVVFSSDTTESLGSGGSANWEALAADDSDSQKSGR
jgi:hypothetical protein